MIPTIIADNGKLIVEDQAKATYMYFNKFFATSPAIDESNSTLPSNSVSNVRALNNFSIEKSEVSDQIKILNICKSYGPDGISPRFIITLDYFPILQPQFWVSTDHHTQTKTR